MLIKVVVQNYGGRVEFVSEDWGTSRLADQYGVKQYPAVFVDDIMVAKPADFGWYQTKGKYTPWKEKSNHDKFKQDLTRMIDLVLSGHKEVVVKENSNKEEETTISTLPKFSLTDLEGKSIDSKNLEGRVVLVELWATWCPPCRSTLSLLGEIKQKHGDNIAVLAIAVESKEEDVRNLLKPLNLPVNVVIGSEEIVAPFGTLGSVPRLFVFDQKGNTSAIFYGASPDLHEKVDSLLGSLINNHKGTKKE